MTEIDLTSIERLELDSEVDTTTHELLFLFSHLHSRLVMWTVRMTSPTNFTVMDNRGRTVTDDSIRQRLLARIQTYVGNDLASLDAYLQSTGLGLPFCYCVELAVCYEDLSGKIDLEFLDLPGETRRKILHVLIDRLFNEHNAE